MAVNQVMARISYFFFLFVLMLSCKSAKIISDEGSMKSLPARTIIANHYDQQLEFKTLSGKVKIDYTEGSSRQSVAVSLRMKKDQAIWVSAPLGVLKAYITPDRVSFYNKLQNEYFDGDFSYFSDLLGIEIDFYKIQNLLLGQAILDLRDMKYNAHSNGENYELSPKKGNDFIKTLFFIEPSNYRMAMQQLSQPEEKRLLEVRYKNYQEKDKHILPEEIGVMAIETMNRTFIDITYKNIEFDRDLNFPYRIPKGYDEIVVK